MYSRGTGRVAEREVLEHPERFELLCANCHFEEHEALDNARKLYSICLYCVSRFSTEKLRRSTERGRYCSRKCQHAHSPIIAAKEDRIRERFLRYVEKTDGCWNWIGTLDKRSGAGYLGLTAPDGRHRVTGAARLSYELHIGPVPYGKRTERQCQNKRCVRPDHLVLS